MVTRELTSNEITTLLQFPTVNQRKSGYQHLIIQHFGKVKRLLVNLFTRGGKTHLSVNAIKLYQQKYNKPVVIVVPSLKLKQDWSIATASLPNVSIYVINTYVLSEQLPAEFFDTIGMLIVDECHWVLGNSTWFSQVIPKTTYDYGLFLSATLTQKETEYLESFGVEHRFHIPLKTGYKLGVVPAYESYNLAISLTAEEKLLYLNYNQEYNSYINYFSKYSAEYTAMYIANCLAGTKIKKFGALTMTGNQWASEIGRELGITPGQVIGLARKWQAVVSKRSRLLQNAHNKLEAAKQILGEVQGKKALVFCTTVDTVNKLLAHDSQAQPYHYKLTDKQKKQALVDFYSDIKPHIVSCKALQEGFTVEDVQFGLNMGFSSKAKEFIQKTGRLLNPDPNNPDKMCTMVNLYVDDFMHKGEIIPSQEKRWLMSAQKDQLFINWITSPDELVWLEEMV